MPVQITYGEGGLDPTKPWGNVVEILELPAAGVEADPVVVPVEDWGLYLSDTHPPD